MDAAELQKRVDAVPYWFYQMDLGQGIITPGDGTMDVLNERADIYFEMGVRGRSVLDVGAWDGFYSFEAERRGAPRVLAVDKFCWDGGGVGTKAAFDIAHEALGSSIESRRLDINETTIENVGKFDVVLFNGIIYHIVDPIHAIIEMSRIANHVLSIETHMDMTDTSRPAMVFYRGEVAKPAHPQFGWGVNSYLMHSLLKDQGFETVLELPTPDQSDQRSIFLAFKPGHPFGAFVESKREFARPRISPPATAQPLDTPAEQHPQSARPENPIGWRAIGRATRNRLAAYLRQSA